MKVMNWIVENWFLVVALAAVLGVVVFAVYRFAGLPTEKQRAKVKEWLIWACIEAEKALQSGTGQLKLRQVYDMFCAVPAFTWVAKIVTFEVFSDWVTDALKTAKEMLVNNKNLAIYVYGEKNADEEVKKLKEQLGESNSN